MKTKETSLTKEQAIEALNRGERLAHINYDGRIKKQGEFYIGEDGYVYEIKRFWNLRYPREWNKGWYIVKEEKKNQKQFKEFDPELFKQYINKFSDKDKLKAISILKESL